MSVAGKWLLLVLVVGGFVVPLFIAGPNGQPVMSLNDWVPDVSPRSSSLNGTATLDTLPDASSKLFKWQDEQGRWHFSSEQPEGSEPVQAKALPELQNVIPPTGGKGYGGSNISFSQAQEWLKSLGGNPEQSK